jgi:hypothetical protein
LSRRTGFRSHRGGTWGLRTCDEVGVVVAPRCCLFLVLFPVVRDHRIAAIEVVADPED